MAGHVLTDFIVVNYTRQDKDDCIHFLTHFDSGVKELKDVVSPTAKHVYTSKFNAWYLKTYLGANPDVFIGMDPEQTYKIEFNEKKFLFSFMESHYNTGSVMIILHGGFGTIFYTGYLCYYPGILSSPILRSIINKKALTKLYLDTSYYEQLTGFQSMIEVTQKVINVVRSLLPKKIYIYCEYWGLEKILIDIAESVNESLLIDERTMAIMKHLEVDHLFTCDSKNASHIFVTSNLRTKRRHAKDEDFETVVLEHITSYSQTYKSYVFLNNMHKFKFYCHPSHEDCCTILNLCRPESFVPIGKNNLREKIIDKNNILNEKKPASPKEQNPIAKTVGTVLQSTVNSVGLTERSVQQKCDSQSGNVKISDKDLTLEKKRKLLTTQELYVEKHIKKVENYKSSSITNNIITAKIPGKKIIHSVTSKRLEQNRNESLLKMSSHQPVEISCNERSDLSNVEDANMTINSKKTDNSSILVQCNSVTSGTCNSEKVNLKIRNVEEINDSLIKDNDNKLAKEQVRTEKINNLKMTDGGNDKTVCAKRNEHENMNLIIDPEKFKCLNEMCHDKVRSSGQHLNSPLFVLKNITGVLDSKNGTKDQRSKVLSTPNVQTQKKEGDQFFNLSNKLSSTSSEPNGNKTNSIDYTKNFISSKCKIIGNTNLSGKYLKSFNNGSRWVIVNSNNKNEMVLCKTKPFTILKKSNPIPQIFKLNTGESLHAEDVNVNQVIGRKQSGIGRSCIESPFERQMIQNPHTLERINLLKTSSSELDNTSRLKNVQNEEENLNGKPGSIQKSNIPKAIFIGNTLNLPARVVINPVLLSGNSPKSKQLGQKSLIKDNTTSLTRNKELQQSEVSSCSDNLTLLTDSVQLSNGTDYPIPVSEVELSADASKVTVKTSKSCEVPCSNSPQITSVSRSITASHSATSTEVKQKLFSNILPSKLTSNGNDIYTIIPKINDVSTLKKTLSSTYVHSNKGKNIPNVFVRSENLVHHKNKLSHPFNKETENSNKNIDNPIRTEIKSNDAGSNSTKAIVLKRKNLKMNCHQHNVKNAKDLEKQNEMKLTYEKNMIIENSTINVRTMQNKRRKKSVSHGDQDNKMVKDCKTSIIDVSSSTDTVLQLLQSNREMTNETVEIGISEMRKWKNDSNVRCNKTEKQLENIELNTGSQAYSNQSNTEEKRCDNENGTLISNKGQNAIEELNEGTFQERQLTENEYRQAQNDLVVECLISNDKTLKIPVEVDNNKLERKLSVVEKTKLHNVGNVCVNNNEVAQATSRDCENDDRLPSFETSFVLCPLDYSDTQLPCKINHSNYDTSNIVKITNTNSCQPKKRGRPPKKRGRYPNKLGRPPKNHEANNGKNCGIRIRNRFNPYVKLETNYLKNTGYVYSLEKKCYILQKN